VWLRWWHVLRLAIPLRALSSNGAAACGPQWRPSVKPSRRRAVTTGSSFVVGQPRQVLSSTSAIGRRSAPISVQDFDAHARHELANLGYVGDMHGALNIERRLDGPTA
jgi:hypothetical protein